MTSVLPLELSSFILGYSKFLYHICFRWISNNKIDDGVIRRTSFTDVVCRGSVRSTSEKVEKAIGVAILSLHLAKNEKTGKSFIIGGGDDGSVNFWDMV